MSLNICCRIINDTLDFMEERLTGDIYLRFLQDEPFFLMENVPFRNRVQMSLHGTSPHFGRQVPAFVINSNHDHGIERGSSVGLPPKSSPRLIFLDALEVNSL